MRFREFITNNFLEILSFFLLLMIATRLGNSYFSPTGHFRAPEENFVAGTLGRDHDFSIKAWDMLRNGQSSLLFGYGSVLVAGTGLRYQDMVAVSLIGLLILLPVFVRQKKERVLAVLFFGIFLLGVPAGKALESGNADLWLTVLFGIILLLIRKKFRDHKRSYLLSMALGILLGFFLNVKSFLLLFVLTTLVFSWPDITLYVWFIISFTACAYAPWLYGVHAGILDVFLFAVRLSENDGPTMLTALHSGNNALLPYVSNILLAFDAGKIPVVVHQILTALISIILGIVIFVKPFFDEHATGASIKRLHLSFPFYLLVLCMSYVVMLNASTWSYDYRILYVLPLLFCFLGEPRDRNTTTLLYLSILLLLTKSLFIPKDRIMNVFLYAHYYFLIRAAVSLWRKS